ncbi:energy-coupling factor transporter ATPase [uncultured Bifidobacterium sp.]|uniref:energy-coupling factor transporter ATPase n=1 Tax=uncultured Bifidobacterium sp. TaxID=165187 RepID=UPI0028DC4247|nr:energy-coupling factor transporter ATPase [uncultured Bifidobacterium sp.]
MGDGTGPFPFRGWAARLKDVSLSYDAGRSWALAHIDLDVPRGQRLCVVGPNGSGKSTLARILAGLAAPDGGRVGLLGLTVYDAAGPHPALYRRARRGIGAVFQNPEDQIITTVVEDDVAFGPENLALDRPTIGRRVHDSLAHVGLSSRGRSDPTRMSGGQQQRVAIAGTLAMSPQMVVLDEPTAMLDAGARDAVMRILDGMQRRGVTIVHVTHRREEIVRADRVIRMERGAIVQDVVMAGGDDVRDAERLVTQPLPRHDDPKLARIVRGLVDDGYEPNGRARSIPGSPGDGVRLSARPISGALPLRPSRPASPVVRAEHLTLRYPDTGRVVLDDVNARISPGSRVAVVGRNGSGKSTLARLVCGLLPATSGRLEVAGVDLSSRRRRRAGLFDHGVGYVMQHPERQLFATTVIEDVAFGPRNQGLEADDVRRRAEDALEALGVRPLADRSPFALSGGQRRLVAIAGVVACHPRLLVLDEPTTGLDAESRERVIRLLDGLRSRDVTVLIVTHDADLIASADDVLHLPDRDERPGPTGSVRVHEARPERNDEVARESGSRPEVGRGLRLLGSLDPRVTLVCSLVLMFSAFAIGTVPQLLLAAGITGLMALLSGVAPGSLLRSVRALVVLVVVMGLFNVLVVRDGHPVARLGLLSITDEGLRIAGLYSSRFALVIIMGALVLLSTTPTQLTDGFSSLLSPLRRLGLHTDELSLVLGLALRFLPTLGRESRILIDAQTTRGGAVAHGSPMTRIRALTAIIIPVFAATLRHADEVGLALDARCYEAGAPRTSWRVLRLRIRDGIAMAATIAYLAASALLG